MSCEGDGASGSDLCATAGRRLKVRLIVLNSQPVLVVDAMPEQETASARESSRHRLSIEKTAAQGNRDGPARLLSQSIAGPLPRKFIAILLTVKVQKSMSGWEGGVRMSVGQQPVWKGNSVQSPCIPASGRSMPSFPWSGHREKKPNVLDWAQKELLTSSRETCTTVL